MKVILLFAFLFTCFAAAAQQSSYKYMIDITSVENDRISVELTAPSLSSDNNLYHFPKVVPGTYSVYNFGRFINDFKAYDVNGNEINTQRIDINTWSFDTPSGVHRITYKVDDTFDSKDTGKPVFEPVGTNIKDKENFLINHAGMFGYFKNLKDIPIELTIIKPSEFYGSTALIPMESTGGRDVFRIEDYYKLIDSPIMYSAPDTAVIDLGDTQILISAYSESKSPKAASLKPHLEEIILASKEYLNGTLPVNKYAFIFYFYNETPVSGLTGALEHSYSSVYSLPDIPSQNMKQVVKNFATHEFFHIITPLNIHSEHIHNFDYNNPEMSMHLWLYEGITEYTSHLVQLRAGLITMEEFLSEMRNKMFAMQNYDNTIPLTVFSKNVLDESYNKQFINIYQRGALFGWLLDIKLRSLTGGKTGVKEMMTELSNRYGKDRPFTDTELFDVIAEITHPGIRDFFAKHVESAEPLPFNEVLPLAGMELSPEKKVKQFTFGAINLNYNPQTKRLFVMTVDEEAAAGNSFKFKEGDEWVKFNKKAINLSGFQQEVTDYLNNVKEGDELEFQVARKNEHGMEQIITLKSKMVKKDVQQKNVLTLIENAASEQLGIRKSWMEN